MVQKLDVETFLQHAAGHPVIDVRAPAEYRHGHIPDAINLPLFSDEERAMVGTLYKQQGRESAMMKGLQFYGANMQQLITSLKNQTDDRQLFVHCWRGGMRSGVVSWMLDLFGYKITVLEKGYKSFRRIVLDSFGQEKKIMIIGGKTGSAKTDVLFELMQRQQQVIDLEGLAKHRGSAFGGLGQPPAPSQEQFENNLFFMFRKTAPQKVTWLEDESQRIGLVNLPGSLWTQMRNAQTIYLDIPFEARLQYIVKTYGSYETEGLKDATLRIRKRLGGLETSKVLEYFDTRDLMSAFSILLSYYDKNYLRATAQRNPATILKIESDTVDAATNAQLILAAMDHGLIDSYE